MSKVKKSKKMSNEVLIDIGFTGDSTHGWEFFKIGMDFHLYFSRNPTYEEFLAALHEQAFRAGSWHKAFEIRECLGVIH